MDLKNLYRIAVFQKVVEQGNFSRAASELRLSKSVVSQHVSELEREFNVRLLNRSTRSVSVTLEGHRLAEAAGKMIHLISNALDDLEREQQRPSGTHPHHRLTEFRGGLSHRCSFALPQ